MLVFAGFRLCLRKNHTDSYYEDRSVKHDDTKMIEWDKLSLSKKVYEIRVLGIVHRSS